MIVVDAGRLPDVLHLNDFRKLLGRIAGRSSTRKIAALTARQNVLEQVTLEVWAKIERLVETAERLVETADADVRLASLIDIKNIGYELGRRLAHENISAGHQPRMDPTPLSPKLCTQADFSTGWLPYWCNELRTIPYYHRKVWEICYVAQALFTWGHLAPGARGLGFGCGVEPLPSLFAKYGANVMATDLSPENPEAAVWQSTAQHTTAVDALRRADICPDEKLLANIEFQSVDMNNIPAKFDGLFDFCWSTCALEHLGSLTKGLEFIENSIQTLRPGGLAVHTTEFSLNEGPTIDNQTTVLYQRHHFIALVEHLRRAGHRVDDFDFDPGDGVMDRFIDLPPFQDKWVNGPHYAHLRLLLGRHVCTSVGIIIQKGT